MDLAAKTSTIKVSGFELTEVTYEAKLSIPKHAHDHAYFCFALQGDCTEYYQCQIRKYRPSTFGFMPPGREHSVQYGETEFRWLCLTVDPAQLDERDLCSGHFQDSVHARGGPLTTLFLHIYKEYLQPDDLSPLVIEGIAYQMLAEIARQASSGDRRPSSWLLRARDLVDENFAQQLTLDAIADFAGIHPAHLAREFRRHFKYTVGEYTRLRRVEYACRELSVGNATVAEIALAAGFADQSHLTRTFKRIVGTTPGEYRKAVKN